LALANKPPIFGLNAQFVQFVAAQYIAANPGTPLPPISNDDVATAKYGVTYELVGKNFGCNEIGSRYFVVKPSYDLIAAYLGAAAQNAYGNTQATWLTNTLMGSTARWKFFGSSVSMTSMVLDLSNPALGVPSPFNQKFYINVDQWDGFPQARDNLIDQMQVLHDMRNDGYVVLSGDIHANFATYHGHGVSEITTTAISSGTNRALLEAAVKNPPLSSVAGIDLLVAAVDSLVVQASRIEPSDADSAKIKYTNGNVNGVSVITANADSVIVSMFEWNAYAAFTNNYANAAATINTAVERVFVIDSNSMLRKVV
jgi:alkaline phosphatase D